ncbi:MAG: site-specific integrase [Candidatus Bathyarchaeia archaeon]|jgi:integrase
MRRFAREYIEKYPSVRKINEAITGSRRMGSEKTVSNYINGISRFVMYLGFSDPETALTAMLECKVDAGAKVDSFIDYALDKMERSHKSVRLYVYGVKKWLDLNGVKVDWAKIELPTATEITEEDRAPTKEELKKLLNHATRCRDRFVVLGDSSSGLRIGTFLSLKVGDIDLNYPDVARLTVERKRGRKFSNKGRAAGRFFCTFISPEAKAALQEYLAERENAGEIITPESPLVTNYTYKGSFIGIAAFEKVWARLLKKAGLNEKANYFYVLHVHTLRKYFRSNCIGVDASYRERWMGHQGLYLDMSYFKAEEHLHLAEYRKAVPHLSVYAVPTEEKKLRSQMLLDFARLQGYEPNQLRKLEEVLARAKDPDEAITEFRKLKDDAEGIRTREIQKQQPKNIIVKGDTELLKKLEDGYSLVQSLDDDKFLMKL